jgi:hypothetical protein
MTGPSGPAPREPRPVPGSTLSLFAVALAELRRDLRRLLDSRWDEPVRRRAEELSTALAQACHRSGLRDLTPPLRAIANLVRLPRARAIPLLPALREKIDALAGEAAALLPRRERGNAAAGDTPPARVRRGE